MLRDRIVHHTLMPHSSGYLEMMISDYSGWLKASFTISNLDGKHFRVLFLTAADYHNSIVDYYSSNPHRQCALWWQNLCHKDPLLRRNKNKGGYPCAFHFFVTLLTLFSCIHPAYISAVLCWAYYLSMVRVRCPIVHFFGHLQVIEN